MSLNRHSIEAVSTAKKFKTPLKASVVLLTSMILAACNTTDEPSYNLGDVFETVPTKPTEPTNPTEPEGERTGVQSLNINILPLNKVYNTTTRDFKSTDTSIVARADIASESAPGAGDGLLGKVSVTISGDNDTPLQNGFMNHEDNAEVEALGQKLPLAYTSTYKDFGDDMRISHIDGKAEFNGAELPVNGVALIGNATKSINMPTEGKVSYSGDATYRKLGLDQAVELGSSVFTADFVNKNLKGDLTFSNAGKIALTATINGNQVSGTAADNNGYKTEGGFFGDKAQYLGGVYEGRDAQGTYGATKGATPVDPVDPAPSPKTGAQSLNVNVEPLKKQFNTTTRDFESTDTSIVARADIASETKPGAGDGLLGPVNIVTSGANDKELKNGFKEHDDSTKVAALGQELPLTYTSTYKDFGNEMRIGHIDGDAVLALDPNSPSKLPVSGVTVIGSATTVENMPTEGKVSYSGDATYRKLGLEQAIEFGTSVFTADFVDKNLKGDLTFANAGNISLTAGINGNKVSGAAADNAGYNTEGGFYGESAEYLGGIYEGNGAQGTYGAAKGATPIDPVDPTPEVPKPPINPDVAADTEFTGFQSNTLSSKKGTFTDDAIGYAEIRDDKSDFTETQDVNGSKVPVDNRAGNNFTSYDKLLARADMTKPDSVKQKVLVNISGASDSDYGNGFNLHTENTKVQGPVALDLNYSSVYKNFDSQMQIGHIYGDPRTDLFGLGDLARVSTVYVQGNGTNLDDMKYMKDLAQYNIDNNINDGMVAYAGVATYMENLHLKEGERGGPVVNGTSKFDVDFVNSKLEGTLTFADGDYKYMPSDNKISINADISGNTFAGNENNIDTAGGFYGEDAKFLGGVYQEALAQGGKGSQPGEGTTFQGTFGAEKQ